MADEVPCCSSSALHDCSWCGAKEGSLPGIPRHKACGQCNITFYCSVGCQKKHWKEGGHKRNCLSPEDRKLKKAESLSIMSMRADEAKERRIQGECAICLEDLESAVLSTLPCSHTFHKSCLSILREAGIAQLCPLCRAQLPPSAEKMFEDAASIYFPIKERVVRAHGSWNILNPQQRDMIDKAVRMWSKAASQGLAQAQYNLGVCYKDGDVLQLSYETAVLWWGRAAEQGFAPAERDLAFMYFSGLGVEQNYEKAVSLWVKAATQGDVKAQCSLGAIHESGKIVEQNYEKAVEWWEKAARQRNPEAQCNLGSMYSNGHGVELNYAKAIKLYIEAVKVGYAPAQFNLGILYKNGRGVKKSHSEALRWFGLAAAQGMDGAQNYIEIILAETRGKRRRGKKKRI